MLSALLYLSLQHSQSRQPGSGALWSNRVAILPSALSLLLLPLLFSTNIPSAVKSSQFLLCFSFASLSESLVLSGIFSR